MNKDVWKPFREISKIGLELIKVLKIDMTVALLDYQSSVKCFISNKILLEFSDYLYVFIGIFIDITMLKEIGLKFDSEKTQKREN